MPEPFDGAADVAALPETSDDARFSPAQSTLRRAAPRVALLVVAAMLLYGSWAAYANLGHGAAAALRAGLTQGASSGTTTLIIGSILETLHAALPPRRHRALFATLLAASAPRSAASAATPRLVQCPQRRRYQGGASRAALRRLDAFAGDTR